MCLVDSFYIFYLISSFSNGNTNFGVKWNQGLKYDRLYKLERMLM